MEEDDVYDPLLEEEEEEESDDLFGLYKKSHLDYFKYIFIPTLLNRYRTVCPEFRRSLLLLCLCFH